MPARKPKKTHVLVVDDDPDHLALVQRWLSLEGLEVSGAESGETALKIGEKLAALGRHHQVVCVTHLAQVACFADQHVKIQKTVQKGRTTTQLSICNQDERVAELARLMGGDAQASALREHAKAMMIQAAI